MRPLLTRGKGPLCTDVKIIVIRIYFNIKFRRSQRRTEEQSHCGIVKCAALESCPVVRRGLDYLANIINILNLHADAPVAPTLYRVTQLESCPVHWDYPATIH